MTRVVRDVTPAALPGDRVLKEDKTDTPAPSWGEKYMAHLSHTAKGAHTAFILSAALIAFFLQPAIRFVDIGDAWVGAIAAACGLILTSLAATRYDPIAILGGLAGLVLGFGLLVQAMDHASARLYINDIRCLEIERAMLTGKSKSTDLPAIFSALGCVPKTNLRLITLK